MTTKTLTTESHAIHPILGCLIASEEFLGEDRKWTAVNDLQKQFLELCFESGKSDVPTLKDDMKSIANLDVAVINKFLKDEGFSIQLDPLPEGEGFAIASVLKILVEWISKGERIKIRSENTGEEYDGVKKMREVFFLRSDKHHDPIACITTKSKDKVYITMIDDPETGIDLVDWVQSLRGNLSYSSEREGIHFPMINYDEEVNISWLEKMHTLAVDDAKHFPGDPMEIAQALQQTKLRMNEVGAKVESAAAMGMVRCSAFSGPEPPPPPPYIVNKPFLVWFEREGLELPYFIGFMTEDKWEDPKDLN